MRSKLLSIYQKQKLLHIYKGKPVYLGEPCIVVEPDGTVHKPITKPFIEKNFGIDWSFLKNYVGQDVNFYRNGILRVEKLIKVGTDDIGIWFFETEE